MWRQFFSGGLTASPSPPLQPGTTRCDVTLMRESQRLNGVGLVFGKIFALPSRFFAEWQSKSFAGLAIFGVLPCFAYAKHYTPNPSIFF